MIQKDRVPQMHASIKTVAFRGIDTIPVEAQVHVANGLPAMAIVRLADKAVAESRERVRAALASIGLALPPKRIAINLAPAEVVKEGEHYDLPIALGRLVAIGTVPPDAVDGAFVLGELSLHGGIEPVSGVLPAAMAAAANWGPHSHSTRLQPRWAKASSKAAGSQALSSRRSIPS